MRPFTTAETALQPGFVVEKGPQAALRAPPRRLDHDDVRAHVGEQLSGERRRLRGELDYLPRSEGAH